MSWEFGCCSNCAGEFPQWAGGCQAGEWRRVGNDVHRKRVVTGKRGGAETRRRREGKFHRSKRRERRTAGRLRWESVRMGIFRPYRAGDDGGNGYYKYFAPD